MAIQIILCVETNKKADKENKYLTDIVISFFGTKCLH